MGPELVRKRARILVIDDDEEAFPYKLLQKEGYNVHYWPRIENLRLLESGEYDLIILDIFGVAAKDVSATDGIGVLEHIKKSNPGQLVIAYSGQKYDLSQARFWKIADDYLGKPSSLIECKEKIDFLLNKEFTPKHYWDELVHILQAESISQKSMRRFESYLVREIKRGKAMPVHKIERFLRISDHIASIIGVLIQVINRSAGQGQ
jgi:DNA-binding response OmpR family regulator